MFSEVCDIGSPAGRVWPLNIYFARLSPCSSRPISANSIHLKKHNKGCHHPKMVSFAFFKLLIAAFVDTIHESLFQQKVKRRQWSGNGAIRFLKFSKKPRWEKAKSTIR